MFTLDESATVNLGGPIPRRVLLYRDGARVLRVVVAPLFAAQLPGTLSGRAAVPQRPWVFDVREAMSLDALPDVEPLRAR